jgi:hypothetical protein
MLKLVHVGHVRHDVPAARSFIVVMVLSWCPEVHASQTTLSSHADT